MLKRENLSKKFLKKLYTETNENISALIGTTTFLITRRITLNSVEYCEGYSYITDLDENENPIFFEIVRIAKNGDNIYIISKKITVTYFDRNLYCYCVCETDEYLDIRPLTLLTHKIFSIIEKNNSFYIERSVTID